MRKLFLTVILLMLPTMALGALPKPPKTPVTLDEYTAVLRLLVEHHHKDTQVAPSDEYYGPEALKRLARSTFDALDAKGITMDHPKRSMWVATVTANLMAQSRLKFDATSGFNYWDPDGDGVMEKVRCSWDHFDSKCDYGGFQMNAGATLRSKWLRTFGVKFHKRDLKSLRKPEVMMPLAVTFLWDQANNGGRACKRILKQKRVLRKADCSKYLRMLPKIALYETEVRVKDLPNDDTWECSYTCTPYEDLVGPLPPSSCTEESPCTCTDKHPCGICEDEYRRDQTCKRIGRAKECRRCERACACELMRRATGGEPKDLETGLATAMGGSVSAWWIMMYYTMVEGYRADADTPEGIEGAPSLTEILRSPERGI